ncbi:hypothetical protein NIB75_00920 [Bacteroides uniformis]|nr:hypothetical protein [Bacteroides uniformis]
MKSSLPVRLLRHYVILMAVIYLLLLMIMYIEETGRTENLTANFVATYAKRWGRS